MFSRLHEWVGRGLSALRRHWLFAALVLAATALRAVVLLAYQQALIFPDSVRYLQYAHNFTAGHWSPDALRQSGYSVLLIPVALKGIKYRPLGADALLRRNLLIWGLGGVIVPFIGIKLIDLIMVGLHLIS